MSADDDTELRDLVIDSLEKKGVLGRIKAELRATVFLALEENEKDIKNGGSLRESHSQQELYKFLSTEKGLIAFSLVQDFLQQFQLDFSLAVLEPEASSPKKCIPRNELGSLLKVSPDSDSCSPLLAMLLAKNQSPSVNSATDVNGNDAQATRKTTNGVEKNSTFDIDFTQLSSNMNKSVNESNQSILSKLPGDDPFFDDPLPASKNNSVFFNFPAKTGTTKASSEAEEAKPVHLSPLQDKSRGPKDLSLDDKHASGDSSDGELKKSSFGMSSLRDLPSLVGGQNKAKEGRRQWKDTDAEQRERFMSLTFGSKSGISESFPSPDGSSVGGDGKEAAAELEPEQSDPLDQDASIEENIEEDLSALGDDLLNSDISSKDENVTQDKSVSSFTKSGEYDYMEQLT